MTTSAGGTVAMVERERSIVCAPIDAPASTARSIPRSSSTASRSAASVVVAVGGGRRRGSERAVAARVVGDHAVAGALERREPITT